MTQSGPRAATLGTEWLRGFDAALDRTMVADWPATRWAKDPIGFAHDVLGVETWGKQQSILESVRDNRHTSVCGGRKVGKDFVGGIAAIWWFATVDKGKTMLFGPTMKQIDDIIYLEIRQLWMGHGRCVKCKRDIPDGPRPCPHSAIMPERPSLSAKGGIRSKDLRLIVGVTSVGERGSIGFSGAIFAIEDEASYMKDVIDDTIVGNLAGDNTRRLMIANPVSTRGFFYRSHHSERAMFATFQIASTESPNIIERRVVYPGIASCEWLEERRLAWGDKSRMWRTHVEGLFPLAEDGQIFTIDDVEKAEERWPSSEASGRLYLGVDVAGEVETGDEIAFAPRRGLRSFQIETAPGLSPEGILHRAVHVLEKHRKAQDRDDDRPVIVIDKDGATGAKAFAVFEGYLYTHEDAFRLVGFRGSEYPKGVNGQSYKLNRDLLYGCLEAWLKPQVDRDENVLYPGGAIVPDLRLEAELVEMRWVKGDPRERNVLIHKDELRKRLEGKSPDRCDALALSTWGDVRPIGKIVVPEPEPQPSPAATRAAQGYEWHEPEHPWDGNFLDPRNRRRFE